MGVLTFYWTLPSYSIKYSAGLLYPSLPFTIRDYPILEVIKPYLRTLEKPSEWCFPPGKHCQSEKAVTIGHSDVRRRVDKYIRKAGLPHMKVHGFRFSHNKIRPTSVVHVSGSSPLYHEDKTRLFSMASSLFCVVQLTPLFFRNFIRLGRVLDFAKVHDSIIPVDDLDFPVSGFPF